MIDDADGARARDWPHEHEVKVCNTLMTSDADKDRLARDVLRFADELGKGARP